MKSLIIKKNLESYIGIIQFSKNIRYLLLITCSVGTTIGLI